MKFFTLPLFIIVGAGVAAGGVFLAYDFMTPASVQEPLITSGQEKEKTVEERIAEAFEKSSEIKGLYMTADVASDPGAGASRLRKHLIKLAETTEINGLVIDVKEVCGPDFNEARIKSLIDELHRKNIWAIARIVVFKDASQVNVHPEWYLTRKSKIAVGNECSRKKHLVAENPEGKKPNVVFWQDKRGGYWLDPASEGARNYLLEFSKHMVDLGFDELQFDYIRFPSDGDVEKAIFPAWDGKVPKYAVMKSFFEFLNKNLKAHKPEIILSADLFGYVTIRGTDVGIGQRLEDIGNNFDYVSFMVYPSHYYNGLYLKEDPVHDLPVVNYSLAQARKNPDVVVYRSLLAARDFFDGRIATSSTATSSVFVILPPGSKTRLRPWLEDFYHEEDKAAGRPYGVEKMKLQIDAAQKVEKHGWILWNAANVYTEGALRKE